MPHKDPEAARAWRRSHRTIANTRRRERYANDPIYRAALLKRTHSAVNKMRYGITTAQIEALKIKQNGLCALCARPPSAKGLCVDHDHATGRVRGLLCNECNVGLGKLGDSVEGLERALAYLCYPEPNVNELLESLDL